MPHLYASLVRGGLALIANLLSHMLFVRLIWNGNAGF